MTRFLALDAIDVRFPTSLTLDGSDAMNPNPDYSAAYVILRTSRSDVQGHGMTFTIGRGNELCVAAINTLAPLVVGLTLEEIQRDMAGFCRRLVGDSQLRWLGPEKGVIHLAAAAIINAVWDLWAKLAGKPVWLLIAEMPPRMIVGLIDFRHISDALTPDEALAILEAQAPTRDCRIARLRADGYPAYTTSVGWLGYPEDKIRLLCREAKAAGWTRLKIKVGRDPHEDARRCRLVREELGPDGRLMIDANQVWEVDEAIDRIHALAGNDLWWIEEPLSPDDILGHATVARAVRPIRVATGEQCHNRVMFKQFLQADAIDVVQVDACRLGGLNEVLAVLLLAAKFDKPVCPHAGGVGLCEYVQHVSMIDYVVVSGSLEERMIEHAAHLHEHFLDPIRIAHGCYLTPEAPGFSVEMRAASLEAFRFPSGPAWQTPSPTAVRRGQGDAANS